jgi:peptidyl-prolyl cis-trans isomerase C
MKLPRRIALATTAALLLAGCASSSSADGAADAPTERAPLTEPDNAATSEAEREADKGEADQAGEGADAKSAADKADKPVIHATGPVAVIDGKEISAERYNAQIENRTRAMGGQMPPSMAIMLKKRVLDRLIEERLVDQRLAAEENLEVSDREVDDEFAEFVERFPSRQAFETFLERNGLSEEEMRQNLAKDLRLRKLLKREYKLEVTEQDIEDYYDSNLERFEKDEQVRARHILIKVAKGATTVEETEARQRAADLVQKAKRPNADFGELAKKHSEGPSASRGGDLGYFPRKRMVPEFSKAAFSLNPGEVSQPVRTQFGFHVIKVEGVKPAGRVPLEEAKSQIRAQLERKQYRGAMKKLIAKLEAGATIERMPENIEVNAPDDSNAPRMQGTGGLGLPQPTSSQKP